MTALYPPQPRLVHRLPPAPHFVGREAELDALRRLWQPGFRGVLALVGLGGAGKTAVAARFLDELLRAQNPARPHGLLVWSFYQEPDAGLFLREAFDYFTHGGAQAAAKGAGLLHLLRDALSRGGPYLLVLDGLERVQRQDGGAGGYGQLEDPLLRGLLARVAEGLGDTAVLVTSRFPLTDLEARRDCGYRHLDVGGLDATAARGLLRSHGVYGDDDVLDRLIEAYGAHALTLDHLGGLIGHFLGGDAARAPEAPSLAPHVGDRQALRLSRLLRAYEDHLPPAELALLCRLCLLRRSVTTEQIAQLFLCTPAVHAHTMRELGEYLARLPGRDEWLTQEGAEVLATAVRDILEGALCDAPLAGPEEGFRQEIRRVGDTVLEMCQKAIDLDFGELARLYAGKDLDNPTEALPLDEADRAGLRLNYTRYVELREHPLMPYQDVPDPLEQAFHSLGYFQKKGSGCSSIAKLEEVYGAAPKRKKVLGVPMTPTDVLVAYKRVRRALKFLGIKHCALQRVWAVCRTYQKKWAMAGPLAQLDAAGLDQALNSLVSRHLVLRESDGAFSVHPAVRDHFYRLATAADGAAWHDLVREQLLSLAQRPGGRLPEQPAALDLVEEAIHHALEAGRTAEAHALYRATLGGIRHLGWKLGEMARGLRVLRGFEPCPEPWDLAWFLRALGELDAAYEYCFLPYFRADIRLLQGRLPEVAALGDSTRTPVAAFLMGQTTQLPPDELGSAMPRAQLLIYLGLLDRAERATLLECFYGDIGWKGDRARCLLLLGEVARRQGNAMGCRKYLVEAKRWILHSGSVEHLALLHLVRARLTRGAGNGEAAQRAVDEGLHLTRQCGLRLYHIELLCEDAALCLDRADAPAAEQRAGAALERALAVDCQFQWGAAEAGQLLGRALFEQGKTAAARGMLERTRELRRRLGDSKAGETERLLGRC